MGVVDCLLAMLVFRIDAVLLPDVISLLELLHQCICIFVGICVESAASFSETSSTKRDNSSVLEDGPIKRRITFEGSIGMQAARLEAKSGQAHWKALSTSKRRIGAYIIRLESLLLGL